VTIGFGGEEKLDEPMEAWLLIYSYQNRVNLLIYIFLCKLGSRTKIHEQCHRGKCALNRIGK
jgi:hypothetical protein